MLLEWMRLNRFPFGYHSRPSEGCLKLKLMGRIAKAPRVVLCGDQTVEGETKVDRLLLCLLEALEHVNDLVLFVQTKFSSR